MCNECKSHDQAVGGPRIWHWWDAYHKYLCMKLAHISKEDGASQVSGLAPGALRAIMTYQNSACFITRMRFVMPADDQLVMQHSSISGWASNPKDARYLPELVRINSTGAWEASNVVFVVPCVAVLIEEYGSISNFQEGCGTTLVRPLTYPTSATLLEVMMQWEKK